MARESYYLNGVRLQELRAGCHLSREQAAVGSGVSTKSLFSYENLDAATWWSNVEKLAQFYEVEPESLLLTPEQRRPKAVAAEKAAAAAKRAREATQQARSQSPE